MLKFQLFRVKVYLPTQIHAFEQEQSRPEILTTAISSVPEADLRRGQTWHIGNVAQIDTNGFYFRLGKTTRATNEVYQGGNFIDEEYETSPYTHAVIDVDYEVCAIAQKTKLSQTTKGIARNLARLLNSAEIARTQGVTIEIGDIPDPEGFISHLQKAHSISSFWIEFSRQNPMDANEDFVKPMQKLLSASHGEKGRTEFRGNDLNEETLEELTRSAAATSNEASALMQTRPRGKKVRRYLSGNPIILQHDDLIDVEKKRELLREVIEKYQSIRRRKDSDR